MLCASARAAPVEPGQINRLLQAEWQRRGVAPAHPVDDAGFLRRAYVDLWGVIPPPEEVTDFLADPARDKRQRLLDRLLAGPRYAAHFADYWEAVLLSRTARRPDVNREVFRAWLRERLAANAGWDRVVRELVTATGVNDDPRSGAVNFLLAHERNPQDLAGVLSRELLGTQIQCAQCHRHPTEPWTQEDFRRFAACFARLRSERLGPEGGPRRIEVSDADRPQGGGELRDLARARPQALDGTDLGALPGLGGPRQALADWMTAPKNPLLARELVNRYWAYLLGSGFVEPVDDLRPSNPATLPRLLDLLTADFIAGGYDLKRLLRLLCSTRAYQLSAGKARDRDPAQRLWSRHRLRPLGPLELLDSIAAAADLPGLLKRAGQGPEQLGRLRAQLERSVTFVFDVDEEAAPPRYSGTVQQALSLMNGSLASAAASAAPGGALWSLITAPGTDAGKIEALYLRTLSRRPAPEELAHFQRFLDARRELAPEAEGRRPQRLPPGDPLRGLLSKLRPQAPTPRQQAYEDLLWALLNSSEFLFRH